ncbi:pentatricopeptide repeat-containing protein At1g59720, chloroplastic/mitochondrial [Cynara cardunculus var. scolymus]|uniref:pentatricopeptide repeat-containing protein At1g59720, chloroplastic/mitochondrial n=1 Tax=Cynara cardunculus var. scolymus TaxID=59895 RepID=UPI000D62EDEE|nr:pentatricopeptide repeat-containing protein At1g59720, chloroplastic/mitochondrial [Cynara cardunculus var. scolymus]
MSHLKQIHAHTLRTTCTTHPHTLFLHSRILHFSSLHDLHYAFLFFQTHIDNANSFAWNTIIRACSRSSNRKQEAILLYLKMLSEGNVIPDKHTFPFVLKACAYLFAISEGRQLHSHIFKLGFASDVYINNSLIHFYGSCGRLEDAREVFDEMPERSERFEPDNFTIQSILRACASLGALSLGMWAHKYVLRRCSPEVSNDVLINNCLLELYCKCGSLETAKSVFERMVKRDVTSWNTMILGFANNGQVEPALEYFTKMVDEGGLIPNSITFSGVLSACRHRGMVHEGQKYFTIMTTKYGIEPVLEHYGCLVDLLARAGLIAEALDVVSTMPVKPDVVIWRSILDACSKRSVGIEVSEEMAKKIMESKEGSEFSGVYMLLSRAYAVARKWDEVGSLRRLMTVKGVAKEPGCSAIEIDGVAHEFFAGDTSLSQIADIYTTLDS